MKTHISVVIPARNCRDTLLKTLRALELQSMPFEEYETIVVDDGSTDGTREFLQAFTVKTRMHFQALHVKAGSAGAARNLGLQAATGEYVLFLDADTIPEYQVLREHLNMHTEFDSDVCILGRVRMSDELVTSRQARMFETHFRFAQDIQQLSWQEYRTANTSIRRERLNRVGGFDPVMVAAEDTELASRLHDEGVAFWYVDHISTTHHHPISFHGYFEKGAKYGEAVAHWYRKAPQLRPVLVQRYGVFARETRFIKKIQYAVRALVINQFTISTVTWWGLVLRPLWFDFSEFVNIQVYRYRTRRAFRSALSGKIN